VAFDRAQKDVEQPSDWLSFARRTAKGWVAVNDDYDDPAYAGGNMERPVLLAEILPPAMALDPTPRSRSP
jgi:hypothetical protein